MDDPRSRSQAKRLDAQGVPHAHRERVAGCYRCEVGEDEVSLDPAIYEPSRFDADHRAVD